MRKKHVVIIQYTTLAENYGLSTYLRNIIQFLSSNENIKLSAIVLKGEQNKSNCPRNVDLYEIPGSTYSLKNNAKFTFACYQLLKRINKSTQIDTIHCLYPNSSVVASVLYKLFGYKVNLIYDLRSPWLHVSVERGSIPKLVVPVYLFVGYFSEFILSFFVDKHIFITEGLKNFYKSRLYLGSKPIKVIPSGIDTKMFRLKKDNSIRKKYGVDDGDVLLGYAGAVSRMRDLDEVLIALSKVNKKKKIKLMIVGDGDALEFLKSKTKKLKLNDRVVFTGRVPFSDMPLYINNFDVGICHLRDTFVFRQSYPMKILEYLAAGLPVLANSIAAHIEIKRVFGYELNIYSNLNELTSTLNMINIRSKKIPVNIKDYDWFNITKKIAKFY